MKDDKQCSRLLYNHHLQDGMVNVLIGDITSPQKITSVAAWIYIDDAQALDSLNNTVFKAQ